MEIFRAHYIPEQPEVQIIDMNFFKKDDGQEVEITFLKEGVSATLRAKGNGSLDAVSNALKAYTGVDYKLEIYTEHSMQEKGSGSKAAAYIGIRDEKGDISWGAGINTDIIHASAQALLNAFSNMNK